MKRIYIVFSICSLLFIADSKGQGLTINDSLIAQDSIHSVTYDEQTVWNARRYLMQKLLADTTLLSGNALIDSFYMAHLADNIGLLSSIRLALDTLYKINSITQASIQNNLDTIYNNTINYFTRVDSSLIDTVYGGGSLSQDSIYNFRMAAISAAKTANDSIYAAIQSLTNARASAVKAENAAISSSLIYEQNEIAVNNIYLATIAIGQADSLINYATQLYNIASQCALSGGAAVYSARSLYYIMNDSIIFNDDQICNSSSDTCLIPPAPGFISGKTSGVCGSEYSYSIDSMINVTGYTWSISGAATIDSGQGSTKIWVSFADTFSIGTINVYATDSCGSGNVRMLATRGYPAMPDSISGPSQVCPYASGLIFTTDSVENATGYTWIVPSGCTIDSGQGTTRIIVEWDTIEGNVIVVSSNACGSSDSAALNVSLTECRKAANNSMNSIPVIGDVKLYPNPTTSVVTMAYHLNTANGTLQLFDMLGKMAGEYRLDGRNSKFQFDAAYLCCGIFSYRVVDSKNLIGEGKLVIIR